MELLIALLLSLLMTLLNSLIFLAAYFRTPAGMTYLGTVHWPGDYFYYLSQFKQGQYSWFLSYDLYSGDFMKQTPVGWVNVFLGKIFSLMGIEAILAYQIALVLFVFIFLMSSYFLIRSIFPLSVYKKKERLLIFLLFLLSNSFPRLVTDSLGRWSLTYYDFWFNNMIPFNRLGGVPHHLVARTMTVIGIIACIRFWRSIEKQLKPHSLVIAGVILAATGFILASIDPVHWMLMGGVMGMTTVIWWSFKIVRSKIDWGKINWNSLSIIPGFIFFFSGLPIVLKIKKLFLYPPYSQLAAWENTHQLYLSLPDFIKGSGPVLILALIGLTLFIRKINPARIAVLVTIFLTLGLFLSQVPPRFSLGNVRFYPAITVLFLSLIGGYLLIRLRHTRLQFLSLTIIFFIVLPVFYIQLREKTKRQNIDNAYFYLPNGVVEGMRKAEKISAPEDVFLVKKPLDWSFPALTGRHVYQGHPLLTIDADKKASLSRKFFEGSMERREMRRFLKDNNIKFILDYQTGLSRHLTTFEALKKIYDNGLIVIYTSRN